MWLKVVLTPPQQRYVTGEPGKLQGRDGVGIVEGSCGYRARGVSIRGKSVSSRNLGYEEDRHVSKRSSNSAPHPPPPPTHTPAAVCHGRARQSSGTEPYLDCSRFLWIAGPRGQYSENIRCIKKPGVHDAGVATSDPLAAVRHGRAMQSSGVDCRRVLWVPGPRGQYSGKIRFIKKPGVQDEGFDTCLNVILGNATGEPGKIHGQDGVGIAEASCGYRARGVSIRGKFVLSRNLKYEEDRHVSKRSSDP